MPEVGGASGPSEEAPLEPSEGPVADVSVPDEPRKVLPNGSRDVVTHEIVGRLLNQENGAPLAGFTVRAFDLDVGAEPKDLGHDITNADGLFALVYTTSRDASPEGGEQYEAGRRLRLHILDPQGKEIHQAEIRPKADQEWVLEVRVPVPTEPEPPDPTVTEVANALRLELPRQSLQGLTQNGIRTLADIRRVGGIGHVEGVPASTTHALEAHANLGALSSDVELNAALIERDYTSVSSIADASRADFVAAAREKLGDFKAAQMHVEAGAQANFLNNVLTGLRAASANGLASELDGSAINDLFANKCECDDCESAVSPLAYLADLLDYALKHLKIAEPGLKGDYYDNIDFTNWKLARTDATVDFAWGGGSPDPKIGAEDFSVRWTGQVQPRYSEKYTFYTYTDDGVRLWVDGKQLIDKWVPQVAGHSGRIDLEAGRKYDIKMEYYERGGGATARLEWESLSQPREVIPASQLYGRNTDIAWQFLVDTFRQPFSDLPASCESADNQVRQVRICVEVLRSYLEPLPIEERKRAALKAAEGRYRAEAYGQLLTRIGTSYGEIRSIRTAGPEERQALADRLGINVGTTKPDHLDNLFLDPAADPATVPPPSRPPPITEQTLEKLFGLVDTRRDPLSEGAKLGDQQEQITRWNLDGVEWNRNTGPDGTVYVRLRKQPTGSVFRVELYRDHTRTALVASGERNTAEGTVGLAEENGSGLSGRFDIKYISDTDAIEISAVPYLLSWRLEHLRTRWLKEDWPTDPYAEDFLPAEDRLPVIDPDVIGPDDFRTPVIKANKGDPDKAFDLWFKRRAWIDFQWRELSKKIKTVTVGGQQMPVPDIEAMFASMYQPVIYFYTNRVPWKDTTQPIHFDSLAEKLAQGIDIPETTQRIKTDLNLTVESFSRLMAIRAKDKLAEADQRNEKVKDEEWREAYSILVQAQKGRLFADWLAEEQDKDILFGPKEFWISLREPVEGDWPPELLEQRPLIDPDALKLDDLPEPTAGKRAIAFWKARRTKLDQIKRELKETREQPGLDAGQSFEAMLQQALGHPGTTDPLQHDLAALANDLNSADPAVVASAKTKITVDLHLTVEAFNRLMTIKAKNEDPDPLKKPTAEEWSEVYAILTQAQKGKREFPIWSQEEQDAFGIAYWNAFKARLPRWRASAESRQGWQQALRIRSGASLIDPDLIGPGDFKNPDENEDVAFGLWWTRRTEIDTWLSTLRTPMTPTPTGLDTVLGVIIGVPATDLVALAEARNKGESIEARLEQLSLTIDAFSYLLRVRDLVESDTSVLDSEWEDVYSILVQVQKRRTFAEWREREKEHSLTLGPDHFKLLTLDALVFPPPQPAELPAWRASQAARREWRDTLQSRIDQEQATTDALRGAVSATEEDTLPMLRDALVLATPLPLKWGSLGSGNGQFSGPTGVAVNANGNVYVTDWFNHRIQKFDPNGGFLAKWGNWGSEEGQFGYPYAVAVDASGSVYVTDALNHRIQKFDPDGNFIETWGTEGQEEGQFSGPTGVTVDASGNVYVTDWRDHRMQKFDSNGQFLASWGGLGSGNRQFNGPAGVATDGNGNIYVADYGNNRMQKFDSNGQFLASWGGQGSGDGQFSGPTGVAVDASGNVYVTDWFDHRIQKFDPNGRFLAKWGGQGSWDGQFRYPYGVAVDASGNVYVADYGNNRIQKFEEPDLEEAAKRITDRLLIDAKTGGCRQTTRVSQAIETISGILWSVKTGQLNDTHPRLVLDSDHFDEEWERIGSYATWRAAMFVFLYPENILLPSLRSHQTEKLKELVQQTRSNRRLTPERARRAARDYSEYFFDVSAHLKGFQVEATCQARTSVRSGDHRNGTPNGLGASRQLFYMLARADATKRAYWSSYDSGDETGYAHSFWQEVPGLKDVIEVIGAAEYSLSPTQRYIYLFARTQGQGAQKLVYTRYNLEIGEWERYENPLDLPGEDSTFTAVIIQRNIDPQRSTDQVPPGLAINIGSTTYVGWLNHEGNAWDRTIGSHAGFVPMGVPSWLELLAAAEFPDLQGVLRWGNAVRNAVLILYRSTGQTPQPHQIWKRDTLYFEINLAGINSTQQTAGVSALPVASGDEGSNIAREDWRGAVNWPSPISEPLVYVFWEKDRQLRYAPVWAKYGRVGERQAYIASPEGGFQNSLERIAPDNSIGLSPESARKRVAYQQVDANGGPFTACFERISHPGPEQPSPVQPPGGAFLLAREGEDGGEGGGGQGGGDDGKPPLPPEHVELQELELTRLTPLVRNPIQVVEQLSAGQLQERREVIRLTFLDNASASQSSLIYLEEAYYFVPVHLALQLHRSGYYTAALDWFRTVYDYGAPVENRKIYYGLEKESSLPEVYERAADWLLEPLNPHKIAATRCNTYTRFTVMALVRCFLEYADAEFTRDTAESVPRARVLYTTALELLDTLGLQKRLNGCEYLIRTLDMEASDAIEADAPEWLPVWYEKIKPDLARIGDPETLRAVIGDVRNALIADGSWGSRIARAREFVARVPAITPAPPNFGAVVGERAEKMAKAHTALLAQPVVSEVLGKVSAAAGKDYLEAESFVSGIMHIPSAAWHFCIPPNPILKASRLHAELNLYKLRTCRNIAGMERQLEPYAAPTDVETGLPTIGASGQLVLPGAVTLQPTPYRYTVLIERAKQLIGLAQQIEAAFLSALEKRDEQAYEVLKARRDIQLARAGVRLQDLRIMEAEGGVTLAVQQHEQARTQRDHYRELLDEGVSDLEYAGLAFQAGASLLAISAAFPAKGFSAAEGFQALGSIGSLINQWSSYERREQEWEFDLNLAEQDVSIGVQRVQIAQDQVRVVGQERNIAQMRAEHAEEVMNFLDNKFTNAELYDWMSNVLEGVYKFFLEQATAMARLAANQLAFERHEVPPPFIQADYWETTVEPGVDGGADGAADRRGLTGSARLLQDIYQLDQYAFETNKRKLQLTKTISLARLAPAEFQRFRETGVMRLSTPNELFDHDFPGHYLRLINRVRTSVVALIPPTEGIHASLSTSGLSRVVIGGNGTFQKSVVRRQPESVALSSPRDATGLFELTPQPQEMRLPFESMGVETDWEFRLPKASNLFDYSTIADVLLTIEYTALDSPDYRQKVIWELDSTIIADRPFSFRHQLADQWYDLHNPELTATPMTVRFSTAREDFPPNLEELKIRHVVLYFARASGRSFEVPVTHLRFTGQGGGGPVGGGATSIDGVVSTRRGNAGSWRPMTGKAPVGEWELALPNTGEMKNRFKNEEIEDILFVITYSGRTPEWPA